MFIIINRKKISKIAFLCVIVIFIIFVVKVKPIKRILMQAYPLKYESIIYKYSDTYRLDPYLVMAVISAESKFDELAQSHKDAKGLMQLTDETAKWIAEKYKINADSNKIYEPEVNINIGCAYLRFLLDSFKQQPSTAIAAYNAGQGNVNKWLAKEEHTTDGITLSSIPFAETDNYVQTVLKRQKIYKNLY